MRRVMPNNVTGDKRSIGKANDYQQDGQGNGHSANKDQGNHSNLHKEKQRPGLGQRSNTASPPENKPSCAVGINPAKNKQRCKKSEPVDKVWAKREQKPRKMFLCTLSC